MLFVGVVLLVSHHDVIQTGSGKTYTMGTDRGQGVISRAVTALFDGISQREENHCEVGQWVREQFMTTSCESMLSMAETRHCIVTVSYHSLSVFAYRGGAMTRVILRAASKLMGHSCLTENHQRI